MSDVNAAAAANPEPTTTLSATEAALDAAPTPSDTVPESPPVDGTPEQTDNSERPEDGEQDVSQSPDDEG